MLIQLSDLSIAEVNLILEGLTELQFKRVAELHAKIHQQASLQVQAAQQPAQPAVAEIA